MCVPQAWAEWVMCQYLVTQNSTELTVDSTYRKVKVLLLKNGRTFSEGTFNAFSKSLWLMFLCRSHFLKSDIPIAYQVNTESVDYELKYRQHFKCYQRTFNSV